MELAKPALDVGLYTNQLDDMLAFWQDQAEIPFTELLPVGGGVHQYRHAIGESVLKINHSRSPSPTGQSTGISALKVFSDVFDSPIELLDPDCNKITLSPPLSPADPTNLSLRLQVNNLPAQRNFYGNVLGLPEKAPDIYAMGVSEIHLQAGEVAPFTREGVGYRYMTMQVFDVVATHKQILAQSGQEGMPPRKLGDVAYISFVLDMDGNWIEISQRKSITGSLD